MDPFCLFRSFGMCKDPPVEIAQPIWWSSQNQGDLRDPVDLKESAMEIRCTHTSMSNSAYPNSLYGEPALPLLSNHVQAYYPLPEEPQMPRGFPVDRPPHLHPFSLNAEPSEASMPFHTLRTLSSIQPPQRSRPPTPIPGMDSYRSTSRESLSSHGETPLNDAIASNDEGGSFLLHHPPQSSASNLNQPSYAAAVPSNMLYDALAGTSYFPHTAADMLETSTHTPLRGLQPEAVLGSSMVRHTSSSSNSSKSGFHSTHKNMFGGGKLFSQGGASLARPMGVEDDGSNRRKIPQRTTPPPSCFPSYEEKSLKMVAPEGDLRAPPYNLFPSNKGNEDSGGGYYYGGGGGDGEGQRVSANEEGARLVAGGISSVPTSGGGGGDEVGRVYVHQMMRESPNGEVSQGVYVAEGGGVSSFQRRVRRGDEDQHLGSGYDEAIGPTHMRRLPNGEAMGYTHMRGLPDGEAVGHTHTRQLPHSSHDDEAEDSLARIHYSDEVSEGDYLKLFIEHGNLLQKMHQNTVGSHQDERMHDARVSHTAVAAPSYVVNKGYEYDEDLYGF